MAYAVTHQIVPATGEHVVANGRRTRAPRPMVQVVLRILRTQLGSFVPDPTRGVDYAIIQKAVGNVALAWREEVVRALGGLVRGGWITKLDVQVTDNGDGTLVYSVTFTDPRDDDNPQTTGNLVV